MLAPGRRSCLGKSIFLAPALRGLAQMPNPAMALKPTVARSGMDREGRKRNIGISSTTCKVLTAETAGAQFVMEQANLKHGGPPRHLHFSQDELFSVLEGSTSWRWEASYTT